MKECVGTIENDNFRVIYTRLSDEAIEELGELVSIREPFGLIYQWNRELEIAPFYWAMCKLFGDPNPGYDYFSFPFRFDIRKSGQSATYLMHFKLDGRYNVDCYKVMDKEIDGLKRGYYNQPLDEFTEEDMSYCINYIGGMCLGFAETAPKPDFYYRAFPKDLYIFGCEGGIYFEESFRREEPEYDETLSDEEYQKQQEAFETEKQEAYDNRIKQLNTLGSEHMSKPGPLIDEVLDYSGYSRRELSLIRRGEARCLLRQLHLRFGDEAKQYERILQKANTYMLSCWASSVLEAKTLKEVFQLPNLEH